MKKPFLLMILDGWGLGEESEGNAIAQAETPVMDSLWQQYPHTELAASGLAVGLPDGQMGNSEVGHLNIGSGRVVYQELTKISKAIKDGAFQENEEINLAITHAQNQGTTLHLLGLLSDGGVHSHIDHVFAILDLCKKRDFHNVAMHVFLDGRDVSPTSGVHFVRQLQEKLQETGVGKIATIMGRYYAMDRDKRWERVQLAYNAIVYGEGAHAQGPVQAVEESYAREVTDEFVVPVVLEEDGKPVATLKDNDSLLFFNFRPDRGRELTRAIIEDDFDGFDRPERIYPYYVTMTEYDKTFQRVRIAYAPETFEDTLGEIVAEHGLTQLRIAETEKYPHVTFFFNGGREIEFTGEDRILVNSPKVATYDLMPEMSAIAVKDRVVEAIQSGKYDLIVLNFANSDMVGHTGVIPAAVQAVETVDRCVGEVVHAMREADGEILITADHGNSEQMLEPDGSVFTAHTTNPVPLILVSRRPFSLQPGGALCDLSPTILDLMDIKQPAAMTGRSLLERSDA
ncbi:MAG: 2,3-bisphosphoglycerate-independent phosphoglycerate mutase [Bacillota bacterium]|jgi:2,3-bisphosphoglycerate-independent phosphoglycerate mutase|nr:2,3-bisphosphoglycerate-independent phosphoglycerate mutase [Bacillota bacterium]